MQTRSGDKLFRPEETQNTKSAIIYSLLTRAVIFTEMVFLELAAGQDFHVAFMPETTQISIFPLTFTVWLNFL